MAWLASLSTVASSRSRMPSLDKPSHHLGELGNGAFSVIVLDGSCNATTCVIFEQHKPDAVQCRPGRSNLNEDIDTILVLLNHTLNTAHLAFYTPQTL